MVYKPNFLQGPKKTYVAYLLTALSFITLPGLQRFYLGKYGSGILYLFTMGLFHLGTLYDLLTMERQVREVNHYLWGLDYDDGQYYRGEPVIEARYTRLDDELKAEAPKSLEARIVELADGAELNQLTIKDLIRAGINLDEGKIALERLHSEGVCEEVVMDGIKVYCFL
jgi:TM2 domain-containing membrane protein YozV